MQQEGFWQVVGHVVSLSVFSRGILLVGGVPMFLTRTFHVKQLIQKWLLYWCLARVGGFNLCFPNEREREREVKKDVLFP